MKRVTRIFIPVLLALAMLVTPLFSNAAVLGGAGAVYAEEISDTADIVGEDEATNPDLVSDDVNGNTDIIDGTDTDVTDGTDTDVTDGTDVDASEEEIKASEDDNESETDVNSEADKDSDAAEAEDAETLEEDPYTLHDNDENDEDEIAMAETPSNEANGPDPEKIVKIEKTIEAAIKGLGFSTEEGKDFATFVKKGSGVVSSANALMGILSLIGVIEDANSKKLAEIEAKLDQQSTKLNEINKSLSNINNQIEAIKADGFIFSRKQLALKHTEFWQNYSRIYLEQMKAYLANYKTWVNIEVKNWTGKTKYKAVYAYYAIEEGETEVSQTYSRKRNINLKYAENGAAIIQERTIGLPAGYVADAMDNYRTSGKEWNVDTYRKDITPFLAEAVTKAMNDGNLGCSQKFKDDWKAASDEQKQAIANATATDLLNSVIYRCACDGVENHLDEASALVTKMNLTWDNTNKPESGIANQIVAIYNTHCFQKEAIDEINAAYDSIVAATQLYSTLAVSVSYQLDTLTAVDRNYAQAQWREGTYLLAKSWDAAIVKDKSGKPYDNYCYITGSLLELSEYKLSAKTWNTSGNSSMMTGIKLYSWGSDKWKFTDANGKTVSKSELNILNSSGALAMYRTWSASGKTTGETFSKFLNQCGTGVSADFSDKFMTHYEGPKEFSLIDKIKMKCFAGWESNCKTKPFGFKADEIFEIMSDADRYTGTTLHDKVAGELFNPVSGKLEASDILAARAQFCRGKWHWDTDEPWYFALEYHDTTRTKDPSNASPGDKCTFTFTSKQSVWSLKCVSVPKSNEVTFSENEFDPEAYLAGYAEAVEMVDTSYKANTDADIISLEEWENMDLDYLYLSDSEDELAQFADEIIEARIAEEAENGKEIKLSDTEKKDLANRIVEIIKNAEKDMSDNDSMDTKAYLDPFDIYGNDDAMEKLAKSVLPDSQIADDGQTMQPVKNMMTAAFYEPYVYLKCEKSGDSYALIPVLTYIVEPKLLVWNDDIEEVGVYDISDDVMKKIGLSMTVRLDASGAEDNDIANIVHYDDAYEMNVLETLTAKIQGSGDNRYAEVTVSGCSPFSISYSKSGAVNTGDSNNMFIYYILIAIAGLALAATVITLLKRRKLMK